MNSTNGNNYHLFECNHRYYLFIRETGSFYSMEKQVYLSLLNNIDNIEKFIPTTSKERFLFKTDNDISLLYNKLPINNLNIIVSQVCNLNCKYCYSLYYRNNEENMKKKFLDKKTAIKIINFYTDYNLSKKSNKLSISFSGGGEPLTNFKLIKYIINYCNNLKKQKNLIFSYKIPTNGLLLTEEIFTFLKENNVKVKISIDGPEEITNDLRIDHNKKGIHDSLINKIELAKKYLNPDNLIAAVTFSKYHDDYVSIIKYIISLGFKHIKFQFASDRKLFIEKKDINRTKTQLNKLAVFYIDYLLNYNENEKLINFETFTYIIKLLLTRYNSPMPCIGGVNDCATDTNGELFLCTRTIGIPEFKIGNLSKESLDNWRNNYYKNYNINKRMKCKLCWIAFLCGGYCNHINILFNNNPFEPVEPMCEIRKYYYELGMNIIDTLRNKRPRILVKILNTVTY